MDLVIFQFLIEHVSRINRILKQDTSGGHGLLIGMEGMGRASATKLATFIANYDLFQIEASKKYSLLDWKDDLKILLRKTGLEGHKTVFLLTDHQIKHDAFLENINLLLNCSDLPSLFENDEKTEILDKVIKLETMIFLS
jgi:dynein heavy chain